MSIIKEKKNVSTYTFQNIKSIPIKEGTDTCNHTAPYHV